MQWRWIQRFWLLLHSLEPRVGRCRSTRIGFHFNLWGAKSNTNLVSLADDILSSILPLATSSSKVVCFDLFSLSSSPQRCDVSILLGAASVLLWLAFVGWVVTRAFCHPHECLGETNYLEWNFWNSALKLSQTCHSSGRPSLSVWLKASYLYELGRVLSCVRTSFKFHNVAKPSGMVVRIYPTSDLTHVIKWWSIIIERCPGQSIRL